MMRILQTPIPFWLGTALIASFALLSFGGIFAHNRQQADKLATLQPLELNLEVLKGRSAAPTGWKTYWNSEYAFGVQHPSDFVYREGSPGFAVGFDNEQSIQKEGDPTMYALSVSVTENSQQLPADKWLSFYYDEDMSFSDQRIMQVNGYSAVQSREIPTDDGRNVIETHILKGNYVFIVRAAGDKINSSSYDKFLHSLDFPVPPASSL